MGLDDAVTQPEAIDTLIGLAGAEVRLAQLGPGRRFHPKFYLFWSSADPTACIAAVGSANLTEHGLKVNGEAAVFLEAESEGDATELKQVWEALNSLGTPADQVDLNAYRALHGRARRARSRMASRGIIPPVPEDFEGLPAVSPFDGSPASATIAWTDGATPSCHDER